MEIKAIKTEEAPMAVGPYSQGIAAGNLVFTSGEIPVNPADGSVPEDIEVLSLVGTKYSQIVRPKLSTMHIDMAEVGKRAMYMLAELLSKELIDKSAHFNATFVKGGSTK